MNTPRTTIKPAELEKRRWMLGSTFLNTLLAVAKLGWGIFSGSTVVLADAIHSISDVVGALLVYAAVRFAPHRSKRFPLGLYKLEDMAAVVAGLGVLFAGYEILHSVFVGKGVASSSIPIATLAFMAVVILTQLIFYLYERKAALRLRSPGLNSDVANWLGDIGAGMVVIIGVGGDLLHIPYIQEIAVIIIALLIFHSAYEVLRDGILSLLDASVAHEEKQLAREYLESIPTVRHVREIIVRKAGSVLFLKATLEMDTRGFEQAHELVNAMEVQLKDKIPALEKVTIHYEPARKSYNRVATLYDQDCKTPATSFGKAECILLEDIPHADSSTPQNADNPLHKACVKNPYLDDAHGKSLKLAVWLIRNGIDELRFGIRNAPGDDNSLLPDLFNASAIKVTNLKEKQP